MSQPRTYAPDSISLSLGGVLITGYAPDSIVKHERNADSFTKRVGADGKVTRTASADRSGRITITLQQASPSNTYLQSLLLADEAGLAGTVPYLMKDNNGLTTHASGYAWVVRQADDDHTNEAGDREWILDCSDLNSVMGESSLS